MEGVLYFSVLALLLGTLGIYLDFIIGKLAKREIPYFEFAFPYHTFILLLTILFTIGVLLPPIISQLQLNNQAKKVIK